MKCWLQSVYNLRPLKLLNGDLNSSPCYRGHEFLHWNWGGPGAQCQLGVRGHVGMPDSVFYLGVPGTGG